MGFWEISGWVYPIGLGSVSIVAAAVMHRASRAKLGRCTRIPGKVESLEYSPPDGSEGAYIPWIEVQLPGEEPERFRANSGSDPSRLEVGQEVEVYYNPDADPKFILRGKFEQWGLIGFLYIFGIWGLLTPIVTEWLFPLLRSSLRE